MRNILLLICLLSSGCGNGDFVSSPRMEASLPEDAEVAQVKGSRGGELRYPMAGEPSTFNYVAASDARTRLVAYLTTATLFQLDAVRQEVIGGICRDWEVSEDGMRVRLSLREGILFSDGVPFTADDVVFTFRKIYEQASNNALKDSLLIDGRPLQVRKVDQYDLEIGFPEPFAAAEYMLATVPILPKHAFQDTSKKVEEYWTLDTPLEEICGLGPFVLADHEPGIRTVLRYNPNYWRIDTKGTQLPYLDRVILEYIPDRNSQLLRFKAGELDLLDYLLRPEDFRYLEQGGDFETYNLGPSSSLAFYWFNLGGSEAPLEPKKQGWFSRKEFRQAINCAIDRRSIVNTVYQGLATAARSLVPSSNQKWYVDGIQCCDNNREDARRFLEAAGFIWRYEAGRESLVDEAGEVVKFELLTTSDDVLGKVAAIIQQDLDSLGISITIRQEESRSVISRIMTSRDYESALMFLDFPIEPADIGNVLLSSGSMHMWNPRQVFPSTEWEARIDQLMLEQLRMLDHEKRFELFEEVEGILAEERPFIPLINRNILLAKRRDLRNVRPAHIFPFSLWNVWEFSWGR